jgi:hypothetical protein
MNSIRRRQRLTGYQSDIEGPSVAGRSAMRRPGATRLKPGSALAAAAIPIGTTHVDQVVAVPIGGLLVLGHSLQRYFVR